MKKKVLASVMGVLSLFAVQSAQANSITVTDDLSSDYTAGKFVYNVHFSADSILTQPDGFVIYDFAGFLSGSLAGIANFTVTSGSGLFGFNGAGQTTELAIGALEDNPAIDNVYVRYTGSANVMPGLTNAKLTLISEFQTFARDWYVSEDSSPPPPSVGSSVIGQVTVAREGQAAVVPLPAAVWGGLALFGMIGGSRLRKRTYA